MRVNLRFWKKAERERYHREYHEDTRPGPAHFSVELVGMDLENAVGREVIGNAAAENLQLHDLLVMMNAIGLSVRLFNQSGSWYCVVAHDALESRGERCVMEKSNNAPWVAVSRALIAAVRHWPEVLK